MLLLLQNLINLRGGGGTTYILSPSGSISFAGANAVLRLKVFLSSGTLALSGMGLLLKTRLQLAAGTLSFSGLVPYNYIRATHPVGFIYFSDTAPIVFISGATTSSTWRALTGTGV